MWRYLLDANTIVIFQRAGRIAELVAAAGSIQMAIVEEVRDELLTPRSSMPGEKRKEIERALSGGAIELRSILVGSREAAVRADLLKDKTSQRGRGEAASIALAAYNDELILVTEDWNAVKRAYRELHGEVGRAIRLHSFIRLMVERGVLAREAAVVAVTAAKQESNVDPPLWWTPWSTRPGSASGTT